MSFDPVTAAFDLGGKLVDKLFPDPAQRDAAKLKLAELQANGELAILAAQTDLAKAQADINKAEAESGDRFSSRWRPFIGWVCGVAFAYHFIVQPLLAFGMASYGHEVDLPSFDMETLSTVLMGMLGLGGLRTIERVRGVVK